MQKTICILLPGRINRPIGGAKVIYAHANYLDSVGYSVLFLYNVFYPSRERNAIEALRKAYAILRFLFNSLGRKYTCRRWFRLSPSIKEKKVWTYRWSRHIPRADIYIATDATTSPFLLEYDVPDKNKFYFIQGYENWRMTEEQLIQTYKYPFQKIIVAKWLLHIVQRYDSSCKLCLNGYDSDRFSLTTPIEKRDRFTVSMLYHTLPLKNSRLGLEAVKLVRNKYPKLKVLLFGVFEKPDNLPDWIVYFQAPDKTTHNMINNTASIYIGTSNSEGMPLPIIEAMACGQAVVCTDISGYREIAEPGTNALISPVGDATALSESIISLIENDKERFRLAKEGFRRASPLTQKESSKEFASYIQNAFSTT